MTPDLILLTIRDGLIADTALNTWCQEAFSKDFLVYLGLDFDDLPPEEDFPIISLFSISRAETGNKFKDSYILTGGVAIFNETIDRDEANSRHITRVGFVQAQAFRSQMEMALVRIARQRAWGIVIDAETMEDNGFPIFQSVTQIALEIGRSAKGPFDKTIKP